MATKTSIEAAVPPHVSAASGLEVRALGATGMHATVLGFGAASLQSRRGKRESVDALNAALEAGITHIDTADFYGQGKSEEVVGEVLAERRMRERVTIATKTGLSFNPVAKALFGLTPVLRHTLRRFDRVRSLARKALNSQIRKRPHARGDLTRAVEGSLRRLRTDYLDIMLLHGPTDEMLRHEATWEELARLREAGKVRHFGVSLHHASQSDLCLAKMPLGLTVVQIELNVLMQDILHDGRLERVAKSGAACISGGPFRAAEVFDPKTPEAARVIDVVDRIARDRGVTRADVALAFVTAHAAVGTVLVSMTTPRHLAANLKALETALDEREMEAIRSVPPAVGADRHS
jgi:aryl-alcohol dehydrogenase-like predicted oxidoreductase